MAEWERRTLSSLPVRWRVALLVGLAGAVAFFVLFSLGATDLEHGRTGTLAAHFAAPIVSGLNGLGLILGGLAVLAVVGVVLAGAWEALAGCALPLIALAALVYLVRSCG